MSSLPFYIQNDLIKSWLSTGYKQALLLHIRKEQRSIRAKEKEDYLFIAHATDNVRCRQDQLRHFTDRDDFRRNAKGTPSRIESSHRDDHMIYLRDI